MGEYAGELPRKFISFHGLENESNVPKDHNTEESENYPDLPQMSEVEIVVIEETETSPTKSLAVLQVTGGKETMVEERGDVNQECLTVGSHEVYCRVVTREVKGSRSFCAINLSHSALKE